MSQYKSSEYISESSSDEEEEFKAPKNFHQIKASKRVSSSLGNKEIWLIKTPKNFPISSINTLPIQFNINESSRLQVNNQSYEIKEEMYTNNQINKQNKYLVLNNSEKGVYKPLGKEISRFYNVSESVDIPDINFDKVIKKRKSVPKVKNLSMRHFPTGYGASDFKREESNDEDENVDDGAEEEDEETEPSRKKVKQDIRQEQINEEKDKQHKDKKEKKKEKKDKKDKKEKKGKKAKKDK